MHLILGKKATRREAVLWLSLLYAGSVLFARFNKFYAQAGMLTGEGLGGVAQAVVSTPHLLMQFPHADTLISFTFKVRHRCRLF